MKLHDLKPAAGSRRDRIRAGRGIAAGKGKTAGRGTKGQKARAGGTIPAWFEGGQTAAHIRVPKLHGFKRRWRIDYQVVNVGRISEYAAAGRFGAEPGKNPLTINSELLRGAGLISSERQPVKILGHGDVTVKLFVAADSFTKNARAKIEAAGGFVQPLAPVAEEAPAESAEADAATRPAASARPHAAEDQASAERDAEDQAPAERDASSATSASEEAAPAPAPRRRARSTDAADA